MRVLMGIDDRVSADSLMKAAMQQFQPKGTQVLVLHVVQPMSAAPPPQMATAYAPELEAEKDRARQMVEQFAARLRDAGFAVEASVEFGDVRERIIDCAAEWKADLILVGSHGRRGLQRFLLGSVAEFVGRHANCAVQIVRSGA